MASASGNGFAKAIDVGEVVVDLDRHPGGEAVAARRGKSLDEVAPEAMLRAQAAGRAEAKAAAEKAGV